MVDFCLTTSREDVRAHDGGVVSVVTALAPMPHPRFSAFFAQIKQELGFGVYVPDCDTTACSFSAATQAGSTNPMLTQPLIDSRIERVEGVRQDVHVDTLMRTRQLNAGDERDSLRFRV